MKNIYIVLSQTGTLFSKAIRQYTKDPYNHASISFDKSLETMYSFGRRKRYNIFNTGFIKESFNSGLFSFFPNARCLVLEVSVSDAEYKAMYDTVNLFCGNWQIYRYNLIGVLSFAMGIGLTRKNHYFCSQFVSYILGKSSFWNYMPELTKPMDFLKIPNKNIVYCGNISKYNKYTKVLYNDYI